MKCDLPEFMSIHLEGGSFRHFHGEWSLRALGQAGCHVTFTLRYELALRAETIAGRLIDHAADRMVDAFVQRAETRYGTPPVTEAPLTRQPRARSCVRLFGASVGCW